MIHTIFRFLFLAGSVGMVLFSAQSVSAEEVNVYSYRQSDLIRPILDNFTAKTGIKVNLLFADKGLEERIRLEGERSPADILLSTDATALVRLKDLKLAGALPDMPALAKVPAHMKDAGRQWVALSTRARVIYASKSRMPKGSVKSYLDLADKRFKGKICMRSGSHPYNLGLIAAMILHYGEKQASEWLTAVKGNLARKPQGNDRAQIKAVMEGECDIAIGNSYYFGLMVYNEAEPEQNKWAAAVEPTFPSGEFGVHMGISGLALVRTAPNKGNAVKLLEHLLSESAQRDYAELNYEFPAVPGTSYGKNLKALFPEQFTQDSLSPADVSVSVKQALDLVNRLDFDN